LGFYNVLVAMAVATTKALLVVFFFMHLKYEGSLLKWLLFLAFLVLAIAIGFTFFDIGFRAKG
jgi:cytochrome c oxidase subunit 4